MANRLTQIATRTGDDGTTGLGDNTRVSKHSPRPHAMGDVDELNSHIGLLLCEPLPADVTDLLVEVQHQLFNLGGELSIPGFELLKPDAVLQLDEAELGLQAVVGIDLRRGQLGVEALAVERGRVAAADRPPAQAAAVAVDALVDERNPAGRDRPDLPPLLLPHQPPQERRGHPPRGKLLGETRRDCPAENLSG